MIQFSHFLSNNSTIIQIELSKCYWFHDVEKLNVFKNCSMEECPCNIARVVQPCKTRKVETQIGDLPKNRASSPHWRTFICTQQNTQFDVSTKTHLHKKGASGTHHWTFKDNFICHNQFRRPITFQSFPLGRRCSHLLVPLLVLPVSLVI